MPVTLNTREPGFETGFRALLSAKRESAAHVDAAVAAIIDDVAGRGDAALIEYTKRFDRVELSPATLRLSSDEIAAAAKTAPADTVKRSECTGKESRHTGSWASTFLLDVSGQRIALVILVPGYTGAGAQTKAVTVEVHTDDLSRVWENQPGDIVSFLVGADEESGRLDVVLSNVSALDAKLRIVGRWTCRT